MSLHLSKSHMNGNHMSQLIYQNLCCPWPPSITCDFQQCGMCDQLRHRPACAYTKSDQSLCSSLEYSMTVKLPTEHHLEFLCLTGGCTVSSESTLFKMPQCWKSHATAHFLGWYNKRNTTCRGTHEKRYRWARRTDHQHRIHLRYVTVLPAKSDSDVMFCLQSYPGL